MRVTRTLSALIGGQIALHSCMAGIRMAAPLQALRQGYSEIAVGVLLGLFAAIPIVLALYAGRLADRFGYHRPMRIAVILTATGGLTAVLSTLLASGSFAVMCVAAALVGSGANFGLIAIQRTASRTAADATELKRVFSWLGLAPALSNVFGPVLAGTMIDLGGFRLAFVALTLLPLLSLISARQVPVEVPPAAPQDDGRPKGAWDLLRTPGLRRLLLVNWLVSSSWDVHSFLVPILGHERGFSASAIGLVLGAFALAVTAVRLVIPLLAHRLRENQVLAWTMWCTALVFLAYPFVKSAWLMVACAVTLGLALGAVQPMIMSTLHQLTPPHRHGEAIALRSMTINFSGALMPLAFGLAGALVGSSVLFWAMAVANGAGSTQARRLGQTRAG
jgi:MFS family permease